MTAANIAPSVIFRAHPIRDPNFERKTYLYWPLLIYVCRCPNFPRGSLPVPSWGQLFRIKCSLQGEEVSLWIPSKMGRTFKGRIS